MYNKKLNIVFSIATYKRENDLKRLIGSINTSYNLIKNKISLTIVISDNNNESNLSKESLNEFLNGIKLIYKKNPKNLGARVNVWKTLVNSSDYGDYVFLVSDDDYVLPDFLPEIYNFLMNNPVEYLITNFFTQYPNLKSNNKQYGLEKPILKNFISSPKENIIITNRILTGTCYKSELIKRMVDLCPSDFYESQWYVQFLGCFANTYARMEQKLSVHQVLNQTFWEPFSKYEDMMISRLKGYQYAYKLINGNKNDLENLLLKSVINYPIWYSVKVLLDKDIELNLNIFKFVFLKLFHLKFKRDLFLLISKLVNYKKQFF